MTPDEYNEMSRRDAAASADMHRQLPAAPDAEQGLLCSILLMPREVLDLCSEHSVTAEWLHIPAHSTIFTAAIAIYAAGKPLDFITLTQALRDKGEIDRVGGAAFIMGLFNFIPTAANASYYIEILRDKFVKREIIKSATRLASDSYDDQTETASVLDNAQKALGQICGYAQGKKLPKSMRELVMASLDRMESMAESEIKIRGISTGMPELDDATGGCVDGDYIAIAGSTTQGKTALAMSIARHMAVDLKLPVGFFSLEMSDGELTDRLISMQSGVNLFFFLNGRMGRDDYPRITSASTLIAEAEIIIEDEAGMGIHELCAKARRMKQKHGIRALFIDYIQLLSNGKRSRDDETITQAITVASRMVKQLAKELCIPIIVLSQIDDKGKVKWARAIEDDANNLWGISHDDDISHIRISKARNGPKDIEVPVYFERTVVRFWPSHMAPPKPAKLHTKKK